MSQQALKLLVANEDRNMFSFAWRIWAGGTSFYIKCATPKSPFKLSLHGPDPRHRWHGFKLDLDGPQTASSGYFTVKPGWLPAIFPGKEVAPDVSLAFRLRVPWDVFDQPGPPPPAELPTGQQGFIATAPPDLDRLAFLICHGTQARSCPADRATHSDCTSDLFRVSDSGGGIYQQSGCAGVVDDARK